MPLAIGQLEIIGQQLAIRWNDGAESLVPLEKLRRACPCAACGGEPDVLGRIERPSPSYSDASFQLLSITPIGGYALLPRWADGHATGIYSFDYIRKLDRQLNQ